MSLKDQLRMSVLIGASPVAAFHEARVARSNAHMARRSKLPGWRIYFRAEMARAIRKWRAYAKAVRQS